MSENLNQVKKETPSTTQGETGLFKKRPDFKRKFEGGRFGKGGYKPFQQDDLVSVVLSKRKVSKTRAGGRRPSFSVLIAVGDRKGKIGVATAKAFYFNDAIFKAEQRARKSMFKVGLLHNRTVPHNVTAKVCSTSVLVHKAKPGTGIVAGGCLWNVFDLLGVKDVVCKCIGASNSNHNMVYALVEALKTIELLPEIAARRNKTVKELLDQRSYFLG